jgi:hypothetical protein
MENKYGDGGLIYKNDRKTEDWHADYNGTLTIEGKEYFIGLTIKTGQRGKFMAAKIRPKNGPAASVAKPAQKVVLEDELDDGIPW